jgi:hypothetical protein
MSDEDTHAVYTNGRLLRWPRILIRTQTFIKVGGANQNLRETYKRAVIHKDSRDRKRNDLISLILFLKKYKDEAKIHYIFILNRSNVVFLTVGEPFLTNPPKWVGLPRPLAIGI